MPNEVETNAGTPTATTTVENAETPTATETPTETEVKVSEPKVDVAPHSDKLYTKQQMSDAVLKRLNRIYEKFGIEKEEDIEAIVNNSKEYKASLETLNRVPELEKELSQAKEQLMFIEKNIDPQRYEDVKTFFKGKELELTTENLLQELETHPEWLSKTTVREIGAKKDTPPPVDEKALAMKMFKIK